MVKVRRIVPDLAAGDPKEVAAFYRTLFDLDVLMDQSWIVTLGAGTGPVQISIAAEGGSGAPVPHPSIEVDDVEAVCSRVAQKTDIPVLPVHSEGFKGTKKDGYKAEDIFLEVTAEYDFPIVKTDDFGHNCPNTTLPVGAHCRLDPASARLEILEACVK